MMYLVIILTVAVICATDVVGLLESKTDSACQRYIPNRRETVCEYRLQACADIIDHTSIYY